MKDKLRTLSGLLIIVSILAIVVVTAVTMIIQAVSGGAVLYPILALLLGSACYYIAMRESVKEKEPQSKEIDELMKLYKQSKIY